MLVKRIGLRNYRVYEEPLDLEIPPGLVGIYGANGSGKSYLVESLLFALWGRTRTSIPDVRTTGVGGDCVAEVEFEHEGHLYVVRRTITGVNSTVRASAYADGRQMAEGVRDTSRYVHSILGMDDAAFRSSVFAEQKQIAAFSLQRPQQRKDLVLKLLGVMPLDTARDDARKDARAARERLESLTAVLPDLEQLRHETEDAVAAADATAREAATEEDVAATARTRLVTAQAGLDEVEELRRRHDAVVADGQAVRGEHDTVARQVATLVEERTELAGAAERLAGAGAAAAGLEESEEDLRRVRVVAAATAAVEATLVPGEASPPDEDACDRARVAAEQAANRLATVDGELAAATAELARARQAADRSEVLSGEGECPLCGQALGDAFGRVQEHRAAEVAEGESRVEALTSRRREMAAEAERTRAEAKAATRRLEEARRAWAALEQARARRDHAEAALAEAAAALGRPFRPEDVAAVTAAVEARRRAAREADRLRAQLERAPLVAARHDEEVARLGVLAARLEELRAAARALGFRPEALEAARTARDTAARAVEDASKVAHDARVEAAQARVKADAAARRLADAEEQHAGQAALREASRHLGRVADLLSGFRNGVVSTVGPRLAAQAADLFAELTDNEYDRLELDPESYEIQIRDRGRAHGMQRFSGSETDLANLAVRVAISEHVRLLSGGTVGLLVLDEVFGPLDEDRKARMLAALERLKGRFRQVLVVTHDESIKAELPHAIEVVKQPGRRATARVLNA